VTNIILLFDVFIQYVEIWVKITGIMAVLIFISMRVSLFVYARKEF